MSSNGHHPSCDGCVPCQEDACPEVAYCVNERPIANLCEHHVDAVCPEHWPGTCIECRQEAEMEMCRTGEYRPQSDPLYDATKTAEAKAWWEHRMDGSTYDSTTNSHRRYYDKQEDAS